MILRCVLMIYVVDFVAGGGGFLKFS